jgi:hypothetical protein
MGFAQRDVNAWVIWKVGLASGAKLQVPALNELGEMGVLL